ncbi:MAG TPA: MFS transporter [Acidimicrobiales bacterium]|nr:MFS transporter [Acidimicrobiales bacterium]
MTLAVLCFSVLIVNLDTTVLNVALPTLVKDLGATSSQLQWIVDAYSLVVGGLLLVMGSLADRVGRKSTLMAGLTVFASGSVWAAFSGSVNVLIAARATMGVGAALMMPSTLSIITDVFRDRAERQRAIGLWAGTSGVGFAIGPIVGGALLVHFWWGSVFLINVPIAALAVVCAVPWVPNSRKAMTPQPDVAGAFLSTSGLGLLLWSIIEAPVDGWSSAVVIGPGLSGLVLVGMFVAWENVSAHPLINLAYFRRRSFSSAIGAMSLAAFALVGSLFLLSQFLQFNLSYSALQAGVRMLPIAAALAVVAPMSAGLNRRMGAKVVTAAGLLMAATGLWWISNGTVGWTYSDILPGMVLIGAGAALVMPSVSASVMGSVPRGDTGVGAATNGTAMQFGGSVGVAVLGSLLNTRYQDSMTNALSPYHIPPGTEQTILGSIGGALDVAGRVGGTISTVLEHMARSAFVDGANLALTVAALVAVAGGILALVTLPSRPPADAERDLEPAEEVKPLQ